MTDMKRLKVLAIAAATGRIGYVFLIGGKLRDWGLSKKAATSAAATKAQTKKWIASLSPDVVVTEDVPNSSTKSKKTRSLIAAIKRVAENTDLLDISVRHIQSFKNKYAEAAAFGERFPAIRAWVPKQPRIWETEPRHTTIFEALALALVVIDQPQPQYQSG